MVKKSSVSLKGYLVRLTFIPFFVGVLFLDGFNLYQSTQRLHEKTVKDAETIATVTASLASVEPVPTEIMSKLVDKLLQKDERIVSVSFFPLSEGMTDSTNKEFSLATKFISANAPVTVYHENVQNGSIIGYINVTIDFEKSKKEIWRAAVIELIMSLVILLLIYLIISRLFHSRYVVLNHLVTMSKMVEAGHYEISNALEQRIRTEEIQIYSDTLIQAANRLKLQENRLEELQEINKTISLKEQALSHYQSTFQDMITHEFRTPLNGIGGGLQLLNTNNLDASQRDSIELIQRSYHKITSMLDQVIQLNKLNHGTVIVNNSVFDPEQLLRNVVSQYGQVCLQKNITPSVNLRHAKVSLLGDVEKINTILEHLMSNAIKFTESGSISLISNITRRNDEQIEWSFDVVDTGIGIEQHLHSDIFNAYVQVDTGDTREYEGVGLGLTLTKKIVELLGGTVSVTSKKGEGSTFSVKLLLVDADKRCDEISLANYKIMHIHTGITSSLADVLCEMDAKAVAFQDIDIARAAVTTNKYDVITLCSLMDQERVIEVVSAIRGYESTHRAIIIYFTEEHKEYNKLALKAAGVDYFMEYDNQYKLAKKLITWLDN